jgi:hypothetical protein
MATDLCALGEKYLVDKCPKLNHTYTPEYHRLLHPIRKDVKLLVEIGIGNIPLMVPLTSKEYKPGASLRMWRDYLPNAHIIGCDILPDVMFRDERIQTFVVDQSNTESLNTLVRNAKKIEEYADIILDDGSHQEAHMVISFKELWKFVKPNGIYIIEDIKSRDLNRFKNLHKECGFKDAECIFVHPGKDNWDSFVAFRKLKKRFLVFMSDNRPLESTDIHTADYYSLAAAINYEYCLKHNYDFQYYRPYLNNKDAVTLYNCLDPHSHETRHASWSKLLTTTKVLEQAYDYILYIDSDCIFKNFEQSIEGFINLYYDKDILFLNDKPYDPTVPCAGFYIAKVSNHTKQFFIDWYNVDSYKTNKKDSWEQIPLQSIYQKYNVGVIDSMMFLEEAGQYLRHVNTHQNQNRKPYFTKFIQANNINFNKNINDIIKIEYDTNPLNITISNYEWRRELPY